MIRIFYLLVTSSLLFGCASLPPQSNILGAYKIEDRTCKGSTVQIQTCQEITFIEFVRGKFYGVSDKEVAFVIWSGDKNEALLYSARKYNGQLLVNSFPALLPIYEDENFEESITLSSEKSGIYRFGNKNSSNISELKFSGLKLDEINTFKKASQGSD